MRLIGSAASWKGWRLPFRQWRAVPQHFLQNQALQGLFRHSPSLARLHRTTSMTSESTTPSQGPNQSQAEILDDVTFGCSSASHCLFGWTDRYVHVLIAVCHASFIYVVSHSSSALIFTHYKYGKLIRQGTSSYNTGSVAVPKASVLEMWHIKVHANKKAHNLTESQQSEPDGNHATTYFQRRETCAACHRNARMLA